MKTTLIRWIAAGLLAFTGISCTTAYDAYGRPQAVVDPGVALLGVAAAGIAGYALADGGHHHSHYDGYRGYRGYGHSYHHGNSCRRW